MKPENTLFKNSKTIVILLNRILNFVNSTDPNKSEMNLITCLWNNCVLKIKQRPLEQPRIRSIDIHKFVEQLLPVQIHQRPQSSFFSDHWRRSEGEER